MTELSPGAMKALRQLNDAGTTRTTVTFRRAPPDDDMSFDIWLDHVLEIVRAGYCEVMAGCTAITPAGRALLREQDGGKD